MDSEGDAAARSTGRWAWPWARTAHSISRTTRRAGHLRVHVQGDVEGGRYSGKPLVAKAGDQA